MRTCFFQSCGHCIRVAVKQQRSHGSNRIQSHAGRSTGSKNAVGQFFPQPGVRSFAPNLIKLTESLSNLPASGSVSGHHSFNCNGFWIALHGSLSILGFYERVGKLVNDMVHSIRVEWAPPWSAAAWRRFVIDDDDREQSGARPPHSREALEPRH